ncbi:hypothetical protein EYF80_031045 [Liparis tanakae]|uniref:Uncharacterized protein n=1 Tax=Liparis tanakae TaxID=230148 RepID=A0A4Z2GZP9_9TELE|nr:hypothetical protein EYF80_031045 [Liparis tanakae]
MPPPPPAFFLLVPGKEISGSRERSDIEKQEKETDPRRPDDLGERRNARDVARSDAPGAVNWCCHALPTSGSRERGGLNSFSGGALRGFGEDAAIRGMRRRRARGRMKPRRDTGSVDNAEHRRRSRFSTYACRSVMLMSSDGRRYVTRENTSRITAVWGFGKLLQKYRIYENVKSKNNY